VATAQMDTVIRHLRRVALAQDGAGRTDGELLASFIDQKDEAAFEALMRRHGPMVLAVCRRVVRHHHDAEDAFQATFLVLARKASSVKPRGMLANWLHGVAYRTAMKARTMAVKRQAREKQVTDTPEPTATAQDHWHDLQPLIDQELLGLPENYRLPIVLCDLEGKTIKDATQQLGWPQGTLAGRLARGRKLLAKRLANRGVVLSAGSLAAIVAQNGVSAGVPASLMSSTVKAATLIAAGQSTLAGVVPAKVAALMEGVLRAMLLSKWKAAGAVLFLVLGGIVLGGGLRERLRAAGQAGPPPVQAKPVAQPDNRKSAPAPPMEDLPIEVAEKQPKDRVNLPRGPAPVQALVKLSDDKKFISVQTLRSWYEPVTIDVEGKKTTTYLLKDKATTTNYNHDAVQAYDVQGKMIVKLDMTKLSKLLKEETIALVLHSGGVPIDPLHLRLLKEGTLLFVVQPALEPSVAPVLPPVRR
jgi:RNA polymerase sigma factor (sigma-70 family)